MDQWLSVRTGQEQTIYEASIGNPLNTNTLRQVVSDRMDLVATPGQELVTIDAKAARPSEAHVVQVMLHMLFLQLQGPRAQGTTVTGEV